ncbi:peptidylprolyl isomerase [Asticcacaulis sp. AC402]|uniref:peptidylprolyl isomerase n=1 Tax=Asticcacaulis sp. AC402 TaxID=1282361 RepID=UPI0003C3FAA3|nr:peptidylprolyl isomerase [Asticcacaulis sp. AC402]ESQ73881.1 peptidyl-prolyl cis-trans isomerase [Asticcacaulis sp. AC402]
MHLLRTALLITTAVALALSPHAAIAQEQPTPDTGSAAAASAPGFDQNAPAPQLPKLAEGMLISVNDDMITSYDLKQRMLLLIVTSGVQVTQENYEAFQQQAINGLINERLQMQELAHWKVKVGDDDINEELERMASQSGLTGEQLLSELKKVGIEPATLKDQIRAETGWSRLVGGRYQSNAKVGTAQVDANMDRIVQDGQKQQFLVAEIFLDPAQAGGMETAQKGAIQLYNQLQSRAAPFQAVARQFSNAPSAAQGGDAGWLVAGNVDPAVEAALQAAQPGEMTPPITTEDGVYIFLLRQKTSGDGDMVMHLKQAAIPLPPNASAADVASAQATLQSFRSKVSDCDALEDAKAPSQIRITDLGEAQLSTLLPDYAAALKPLKGNQASGPLRNSQFMNVVYVCDRRLAGENALTREQVESQLVNTRLSMLGKRYLREIRGAATIENH